VRACLLCESRPFYVNIWRTGPKIHLGLVCRDAECVRWIHTGWSSFEIRGVLAPIGALRYYRVELYSERHVELEVALGGRQ